MKKWLWLCLLLPMLAWAQKDEYDMGGSSAAEDIVASVQWTSPIINLYPTSSGELTGEDKGGNTGFHFMFQEQTDNSTHDSVRAILRVTTLENATDASYTWCVIDTFDLWTYGFFLDNDMSFFLVCDTLDYISAPYCDFIIDMLSGAAGDTSECAIKRVSQKGIDP